MATNGVERRTTHNLRHANTLGGLLYDGPGRRMKASHANKGSRRYHYYTTCPDSVRSVPGPVWRFPAHDIEALVDQHLRAFLTDRAAIHDAVAALRLDAGPLAVTLDNALQLARSTEQDRRVALELVRRIDVGDERLSLTLCLDGLLSKAADCSEPLLHTLTSPITRIRRAGGVNLTLVDESREDRATDPALVKLIVAAHAASDTMLRANDQSVGDVATSLGYSSNYFKLLLRLATLAPDIVAAILDGKQPHALSRQRLARITNLPVEWSAQRVALGF